MKNNIRNDPDAWPAKAKKEVLDELPIEGFTGDDLDWEPTRTKYTKVKPAQLEAELRRAMEEVDMLERDYETLRDKYDQIRTKCTDLEAKLRGYTHTHVPKKELMAVVNEGKQLLKENATLRKQIEALNGIGSHLSIRRTYRKED